MVFLAATIFTFLVGAASGAEQLDSFPVPNNTVSFILPDPARNQFIIGGDFDRIGPFTGSLVGLDKVNASLATPTLPAVSGRVHVIVSDGAGGVFIGGSFNQVGGIPRSNLAHILPDGSLNLSWNPGTSGLVRTMIPVPPFLYVGGIFNQVAGAPRNNVAAVALATGEIASWNPNVTLDFTGNFGLRFLGVTRLANLDSRIYIAGSLNAIGGVARGGLGAVSLATGALDPWNPAPTGPVANGAEAVTADPANNRILVGGPFNTISGVSRSGAAALNPVTGAVLAWNPNVAVTSFGSVGVIVPAGGTVYLGGFFSNVGGSPRSHLAEVNASTGAVTAWNPDIDNVGTTGVAAIVRDGSTVYVGGGFGLVNGLPRRHLVALDATSGLASAWEPLLGAAGLVFAVSLVGENILAGGGFDTIGGTPRNKLAAIDATSGAVLPWSPEIEGRPNVADLDGDTLYLGGDFSAVNSSLRSNLAALSATTGALLPWNPSSSKSIDLLDASGPTVLVGLNITFSPTFTVGGAARAHLAALDKISAVATAWNPLPGDSNFPRIQDLLPFGDRVFVSGGFETMTGQSRENFAAVDSTTGATLGLFANSDSNFFVLDTEIVDGSLFMVGVFNTVNGQPRLSAAAINPTSGALLSWNPGIDGIARDIVVDGDDLIIAGQDFVVGGSLIEPFVRVDRVTGVARPFEIRAKGTGSNIRQVALLGDRFAFTGLASQIEKLGDGRSFQVHDLVPNPPVLRIVGGKSIRTGRARIVLRGTSRDADRVEFKFGRGQFKPARGSAARWKIPLKLSPGRNIVQIRAVGPGGSSPLQKIVIRRG